jgi:hypothetical protein
VFRRRIMAGFGEPARGDPQRVHDPRVMRKVNSLLQESTDRHSS